eukprot:237010_1
MQLILAKDLFRKLRARAKMIPAITTIASLLNTFSNEKDDGNDEKKTNDIPHNKFTDALNHLLASQQHFTSIEIILNILSTLISNPQDTTLQDLNYDQISKQITSASLQLLLSIGFEIKMKENKKLLHIKIDNWTLSFLIFVVDKIRYEYFSRTLQHRQSFSYTHLMVDNSPKFKDQRKQAVFQKISNSLFQMKRNLIYSRYKLLQLPKTIPNPTQFMSNKIKIRANIYEYSKCDNESEKHFYVNFSDANLFGFYSGSLFAQDEIMTLEQPILCALREKLISECKTDENTKLSTSCLDAVIILNCLKNGNFTQQNLNKIYGSKFARSGVETVVKCIDICEAPISTNIICIAALCKMMEKYTFEDIDFLSKTAFCGFNGAKMEILNEALGEYNKTQNSYTLRNTIIVHTGNWGCGAFGGNIEMHFILQCVAAVCAGIDMLYYHSVDINSMEKAQKGRDVLLNMLYPRCKDKYGNMDRDVFFKELLNLGYSWGCPNGT